MRQVYELVEEALCYVSQWRAWAGWSVLSQLLAWDGTRPQEPLQLGSHFSTVAEALESGRRSVQLLGEATTLLNACRSEEQVAVALRSTRPGAATDEPVEARRLEQAGAYERRLAEDRRGLTYALDTMVIMTELLAYHDALYRGDSTQAETAWANVTKRAEALDFYLVPLNFEWPGPGVECQDALTRTQLRALLRRCRRFRLEQS